MRVEHPHVRLLHVLGDEPKTLWVLDQSVGLEGKSYRLFGRDEFTEPV